MVQARKAFTGCIAAQPLLVFAGGFVLMLLFVALSFTPGLLDTGDSEADSPGQLFALNEPAVAQAQVLSAIIEDSNEAAVSSQPTLSQAEYLNWFIMTSRSDNFFTAATMQELYAYQQALGPSSFPYDQDQIENPPSFRGQTIDGFPDYCHKPTYLDGRCASFYSPLEVIVFQGEPFTSADVANLTDSFVEQRLREAYENEWPGGSDFFVSADFFEGVEQSPPVYRAKYSQFYLFFGGPLPDYNTVLDKEDEQQQEVQEWSTQYIDFLEDASPRTFKANYYSDGFSSVEIGRLVQGDLLLTAAAGVSVALVVGMQTGSTIIAIVGVLGVAWSYPCALAIYHGILGIKISPQLNLLAIFIILGIGADDIFVMLDAWKQSEHEPESEVGPKGDEGLPQRVDWVWSRAANAMFVTSLTTAVAFGVTSASPIPAIASFGTLSSLMVLAVYCHTITTFAAFVVLWHLWGMEKQCCCRSKLPDEYCGNNCCGLSCWNTYAQQRRTDEEALKPGSEASQSLKDAAKARKEAHEAAARRRDEGVDVWAPEPLQSQASKKLPAAAAVAQAGSSGASAPGQAPGGDGDDTSTATHRAVDISSFRTIEQFFYKYWAPFTYNFRFPLLGLFLCLLVLSAVGAAYLEGPDKQEVGLPEESQIYQIVEILQPKFRPSESQGSGAEVNGIWGVDPGRPLDRSGIDPNDENNVGSVRYDQDFNPTSVAAQEHLAQVCQDLVGLRFNPADDSSPYFLAGGIGMFCPVQMFVEWQREQFGAVQAYTDKVQMASMMWNFSQTYQDPNYNASDPVSVATVSQFPVKDLVGEFFGGVTGQAGDELLFIRSRFNLSLSFNPGRVEQQKHFDAWTEHFDEINEQAEEGYNKGFTSSFFFAFLQTSNVMVQATWQAVGASVAVAAVCLLVASGNWRVALVALVMVASIVLGILGMFVALGRKLDFVESISASVLVGLSVDYSTHIIISYATSRAKGTFFRTRYALLELGVSIVGGASTSLISSSFLFGAALPFFTIFGSTLFLSLLIAFLYTMLFLPPMLIVFGPEQYPDGDFYVFLSDMLFGTDLVEQAHKQRRAAEMELASSSGKSRQLEEGGPASGGNDEKASQNPAAEV